jgi:hypothetical protein
MKTTLTTRLASLAFATLFTLATLAGIDTLAEVEADAPQMAQAATAGA